jgi:hypothetical protein
MMRSLPVTSEAELFDQAVNVFAVDLRHAMWPQAFLRISGVPMMAQSAALEEHRVMLMVRGNELWEKLHQQFCADLAAITSGKLTRERKKQIKEQAHRVQVRITMRGDERPAGKPRDLTVPDLEAALGYALQLMITRQYGHRLGRCKQCSRFFLRQTIGRGQPERYCSPDCYKAANSSANASRAKDYRARTEATARLAKRWPTSAAQLVRAIKEPGLTADELVARATQHATASPKTGRKHK